MGFGAAGASAAISALETAPSAKILILDRESGGGASVLSGGVVYSGGGTPYQKEAGYDETPDNMFSYLKLENGDAVDEATLRKFCDGSVERLAWLEKHGVKFQSSLCSYKTSYPTDRHYLYFSGNEKAWPYNEVAKPVPRGHRTLHPGLASGHALWNALAASVLKMGAKVQPLSRVENLIMRDGKVAGISYKTIDEKTQPKIFSRYVRFRTWDINLRLGLPALARIFSQRADRIWDAHAVPRSASSKSVVLSAGGFAFNLPMRDKHVPAYNAVAPLGTPGDDGSGIRLGQQAGGITSHMNRMSAWRFLSPPSAFIEGIAVSSSGQRIAREDLYGATFTKTFIEKHDGKGYLILDSTQMEKAKQQYKDQTQPLMRIQFQYLVWITSKKGKSLADLAAKIRVPPSALEESVEKYNHGVSSPSGDPAHKTPEYSSPILKAPFYALDISIVNSGPYMCPGITLGGLKVNGRSGRVLDMDENEIDGLYAAGRNAVGVCSNSYVSGLSLADCVFSGRRAGEHAATMVTVRSNKS